MSLLTPSYTIKSVNIAKYLVDFLVYSQFTLIYMWVISALQAENQKKLMFKYIEVKNY